MADCTSKVYYRIANKLEKNEEEMLADYYRNLGRQLEVREQYNEYLLSENKTAGQ